LTRFHPYSRLAMSSTVQSNCWGILDEMLLPRSVAVAAMPASVKRQLDGLCSRAGLLHIPSKDRDRVPSRSGKAASTAAGEGEANGTGKRPPFLMRAAMQRTTCPTIAGQSRQWQTSDSWRSIETATGGSILVGTYRTDPSLLRGGGNLSSSKPTTWLTLSEQQSKHVGCLLSLQQFTTTQQRGKR
jgi:hypothetical protein